MSANGSKPDDSGLVGTAVTAAKSKALGWLLRLIAPFAIPIFVVIMLAMIVGVALSPTGNSSGPPSKLAQDLIPPDMLSLYQSDLVKQQCLGLSWTIVASIVHQESNDGRNPGTSTAGAMGPSQFLPTTWDKQGQAAVPVNQPFGRVPDGQGYGLDGDGDGIADIMNPLDSVPATARMLCANGGDNRTTLPQAIYSYNHAWWYVYGGTTPDGGTWEGIIPFADLLSEALPVGTLLSPSLGEPTGLVLVTPDANLPGQPVTPETVNFLQVVAGIFGKPLVCTIGTNHAEDVIGTNRQSDHFTGHACDFGMIGNGGTDDGPVGDEIATACLIAAGVPPQQAIQHAYAGGVYTMDNVPSSYGALRVQCIWKTDEGGNHHNHVHIGARPEGEALSVPINIQTGPTVSYGQVGSYPGGTQTVTGGLVTVSGIGGRPENAVQVTLSPSSTLWDQQQRAHLLGLPNINSGDTRWFVASVFLPTNRPTGYGWDTSFEIHQVWKGPNLSYDGPAPFNLDMAGDRWRLAVRGGNVGTVNHPTGSFQQSVFGDQSSTTNGRGASFINGVSTTIEKGVWHDWLLGFHFDPSNSGWFEAWHNGTLAVPRTYLPVGYGTPMLMMNGGYRMGAGGANNNTAVSYVVTHELFGYESPK